MIHLHGTAKYEYSSGLCYTQIVVCDFTARNRRMIHVHGTTKLKSRLWSNKLICVVLNVSWLNRGRDLWFFDEQVLSMDVNNPCWALNPHKIRVAWVITGHLYVHFICLWFDSSLLCFALVTVIVCGYTY